jgi:hypothetical protein
MAAISFLALLLFGGRLAQAMPATDHGTHASNIAPRSLKVDVKTNPDFVPNGVAAYAHALKKWSSTAPGELAESLAAAGGSRFQHNSSSIIR